MTNTVIEFPSPQNKATVASSSYSDYATSGTAAPHEVSRTKALRTATGERFGTVGAAALQPIPIDLLYQGSDSTSSEIARALGLLAEAIQHIEAARTQEAENPLAADSDIQALYVLLPELFRCRAIGDGFGTIINSLYFAFINLHGKPLTSDQMTAAWRTLKALREGPFISFEQALEQVAELEDAEFAVDPAALAELLEESVE